MRREGTGGTHGGVTRQKRHSLGQPWRKFCGKLQGGNRMRGTQSRGRGETAGVYERGVVDAGMETGDSQVGG